MENLLNLPRNSSIQETERKEIDQVIEQTIALHKENGAMITKLTMDSVTALTASESRSKELAQQDFTKRLWNNFTGKNKKIRVQIDGDITRVQYASQQMIQKLAEQNLLTFDLVTAVNNKLNTLVLELDEEINQIYQALGTFFKQTRSDIVQLESRVEKLERNVDLLHWNATIEYQMYNGMEYSELLDIEKIVCLSNDFFRRTTGKWSTPDLMLLKSTLSEIGLPVKSKMTSKEFYEYLIQNPASIDRLFDEISLDGLLKVEIYEAPLVKGIEKLTNINGEERYLYETLAAQLDSMNISYDERNLQLSMIHQYLLNNAYMNSEMEVNVFDFIVELLVGLKMIHDSESIQENIRPLIEAETKGNYDVFLIDFGTDKLKVIGVLGELSGNVREAQKKINQVPTIILFKLTKEEADIAKNLLTKAGATVITKMHTQKVAVINACCSGRIKLKGQDYFTKEGYLIEKGQPIAEISSESSGVVNNYTSMMASTLDSLSAIHGISENRRNTLTKIDAPVSGTIISILPQEGEAVYDGQPIMFILSDE